MSTPSSPASTRGTSPAPMLTPRSKIKALLATVESSDEEGSDSSAKKTKIGNLNTSTAALLGSDNDDGDESDVVDIRPRGKLASRMQGAGRTTTTTTTTAATSPPKERKLNQPEDARERVRKMFEREQELENAKTQEAAAPTQDVPAEDDDDEEDEDLPVVPRRFQRRQARETTPEDKESTPRQASPGLFVSPAGPSPSKNTDTANSDSDEDDLPSLKSDRFKALVERKRQERLAREAAEEAKREERRAQQEKLSSEMGELDSADDNVSDITDDDGGRKLTQDGARPSRKASRKAVEEMNRETQRMARSMQLAHDAKTRKKISKNSLFERFNFRPAGEPQEQLPPQPQSSSRPTTPQSDVEMGDAETPPTSPPSTKKQAEVAPVQEVAEDDCEDLPTLDAISTSPTVPKVDKGKGKAIDVLQEAPADTKTKRRVRVKFPPLSKTLAMAGSDDELQITAPTKDKINAVFDSVPLNQARESRSLQAFRALALVRSPETSRGRRKVELSKMTPSEMLSSLQQKARAQAKVERDRRMDLLKSQGIEVQTVEERERQMEEVENIVAKAREEAEKLRYQERGEVKKDKKGDTAADPLAWDDSDDEYQASEKGDNEQLSAIELSGSEDEGDGEADDAGADADDESDVPNPMFDDEAEESENEEADALDKVTEIPGNEGGDDDDEPQIKRRRARNKTAVLSDDEDDETITATPKPVKSGNVVSPAQPSTDTPAAPSSVLRSAKKTFIPGLPVQGPAGLGLTQIFAGTMDDSQMSPAPNGGPTQSMLPDFDDFPNSNFSATADQPMDDVIESTQLEDTQRPTQGIKLNMSQSQMHGLDSLMREGYDGQESQTIELSQDGGFQTYTPIRDRFVEPPHSTVNTVVTGKEDDDQASPLVRRGRLRRKAEVDTAAEPTQPLPSEVPKPASAFNVMKEQTKQKDKRRFTEAFDKKKSKAKEMVEQEAEESDDEYAGLGGVDGEDSDNESIASMKEMIDDEGHDNADESKLAAFYADRTRAEDEKGVEKLFKDITTGMLRRKRGADYDLSDSDDDGEARKRAKRRQFAKMQKALYSDERVKKMAENPGNQAFLRTIEDRGSDDEMDILEITDVPSQPESQSPSQSQEDNTVAQTIPDSQPRKPLGGVGENRPPAATRRTKEGKKPSNLGEVRETLSNLLEEPEASVIPATEAGSDSEDEQASPRNDKENRSPNSRRSRGVVDRISLKRTNSNPSTNSNKLASAAAAAANNAFRVPSLLRRATTNSSMLSTSTSSGGTGGTMGSAGGFGEEAKIKKGAGKRSGVMSRAAPENDGHARIQESERRREEKKMKGAERRIGVVGGLLGRGSFE